MPQLHTLEDNSDNPTTATFIDVSNMQSPLTALRHIDTLYRQKYDGSLMTADLANAINRGLIPNIVPDSVTNQKFRAQEMLQVNAAQGVIKGSAYC